jgi:hypothetical protein
MWNLLPWVRSLQRFFAAAVRTIYERHYAGGKRAIATWRRDVFLQRHTARLFLMGCTLAHLVAISKKKISGFLDGQELGIDFKLP